jgi:signal transduction histidine kinase
MLAPAAGMAVRYAGEDLTIETPRPPLAHVLQNLISNAIKHHDRAEGEIIVTASRTEAGVMFSVQDDGPGIPAAAHKRIFDIFQTLATRPGNETCGVGLSIVRKTVEARGGKVWVESDQAARGARFVFTWPEVAVTEGQPEGSRAALPDALAAQSLEASAPVGQV